MMLIIVGSVLGTRSVFHFFLSIPILHDTEVFPSLEDRVDRGGGGT